MPEAALDPRLNAFRPDLGDARLRGAVAAERYVEGEAGEIATPVAPVRKAPRGEAMRTTEALLGERVKVFERAGGWCWVQLERDGYVGYVEEAAVAAPDTRRPTHRIAVPRSFVYPDANLKSEPARPVFLNGLVRVAETGEAWSRLQGGGWIFTRHIRPADLAEPDAVAVAERFVGVPYLWGGKTHGGLDCSGLVQVALQAAGLDCPRDTDMMERALGGPASLEDDRQRGDLVFWKGHVGIMLDGERLLHANGHHMLTVVEPLAEAVARIASLHGTVTSVRRMPPPGA